MKGNGTYIQFSFEEILPACVQNVDLDLDNAGCLDLLGCVTEKSEQVLDKNFNYPPSNINPDTVYNCGTSSENHHHHSHHDPHHSQHGNPHHGNPHPGNPNHCNPHCCKEDVYQPPLCDKKKDIDPVCKVHDECDCPMMNGEPKISTYRCDSMYPCDDTAVYHSPAKHKHPHFDSTPEDPYQGCLTNKKPASSDHYQKGSACCCDSDPYHEPHEFKRPI